MDDQGLLIVTRRQTFRRDLFRAYKIELDGLSIGKVKRNSVLTVSLAPGSYVLKAKIDWTESNSLPVHIASESTVRVRVEPAVGAVSGFLQMFNRHGLLNLVLESDQH